MSNEGKINDDNLNESKLNDNNPNDDSAEEINDDDDDILNLLKEDEEASVDLSNKIHDENMDYVELIMER